MELAKDLLPISLGVRKLLQLVLDICAIAEKNNVDSRKAVWNQKQLIIVNHKTQAQIISELQQYRFLGLNPETTFFMVQKELPGYRILETGEVEIDSQSEPRLHNHGAMKMQQVLENQIFYFDSHGIGHTLSFEAYKAKVADCELGISYNIEDIDHIENQVIDLPSIALGLVFGEEGYGMVMTSVKQKSPPQKGGFFAYHLGQRKIFCFESDSSPEITLEEIHYLNKNVNMFPNPARLLDCLRDNLGNLPAHPTIKGDDKNGYAIYPQPPQGDLNFILKTRVIIPVQQTPIRSLKEQRDIPDMMLAMKAQDEKPGFKKLAQEFGVI